MLEFGKRRKKGGEGKLIKAPRIRTRKVRGAVQ